MVGAYIIRIEEIDQSGPELNAVIYLNPDAISVERQLHQELESEKPRSVLHGIPVLLKDNIDTSDMPTTAGSRLMAGSIPPDDALIVQKLREQGTRHRITPEFKSSIAP